LDNVYRKFGSTAPALINVMTAMSLPRKLLAA